MPVSSVSLLVLLLCEFLGGGVLSVCPSVCSCSGGHRVVDCSLRSLIKVPVGLQHNILFLNLSFNSLQVLDSQLSSYGHLRTLDLSYNHLQTLPPALPRSLWEIRVAGNQLQSLDKKDTAYHWNLKVLDISQNALNKVVFINNTLLNLKSLNLSWNRFWTVPTNMPPNLECIDLSHNYLVQILPGSLDRLPKLVHFYLHANRFSWLFEGVLDKLTGLEMITLGDNPWACEEEENMTSLLQWAEQTQATILGCPCYTKPICGQTPNRENTTLFTWPSPWMNQREGRDEAQSPVLSNIHQDRRSLSESEEKLVLLVQGQTSTPAPPQSSTKNPQSKNHAVLIHIQTFTMTTIIITAAFTSL
ncbi:oligodendrocyte-myelin glycoprotein [Austrofundulus limnaeus]|uniref:Oligodendrocyte-myelin glycoprotein n=1 Tax=Austrofundulus limnaeus TaxID=52670 RepID=A0A2I4C9J9_AUSLI|nr:PREDICTED: oligodendrocyte-myelin glycoprotein [Austrofundulus limnaeus]